MDFDSSPFEIGTFHGPKVFVDSLEDLVVDVVTQSEFGEKRDLGVPPKMGLDLMEINRFARPKVVFDDRKDGFASCVLEVLLPQALPRQSRRLKRPLPTSSVKSPSRPPSAWRSSILPNPPPRLRRPPTSYGLD